MGNIDEKKVESLLGRIDMIKKELAGIEEELRAVLSTSEPEVIDISISDIEMPVAPVIEPAYDMPAASLEYQEPQEEMPMDIDVPEPEAVPDFPDAAPELPDGEKLEEKLEEKPEEKTEEKPEAKPAPEGASRKSILDTAKAAEAVMDVMADKQAWRTDRPGMPVRNIISAISLNDRVLLINVLFGEDPLLFQETIAKFNAMGSLDEALSYISQNHSDWDMNSEPVYRLMMAVRRKLG